MIKAAERYTARLSRDGAPLMLRGAERISDHVEADLPDRASAADFCLGRLARSTSFQSRPPAARSTSMGPFWCLIVNRVAPLHPVAS